MRSQDSWSQDVVLRAMCDSISLQSNEGTSADFILVTGDLAFSGKAGEYELAAAFFDAISEASGVPAEHIFCIPGNHDIDRECQKLSFLGARHSLHSQNEVDSLLSPAEDIETLLNRQENYRSFQDSYFKGQERRWTKDGLGYVSCITIDDIQLAIVGLDSAWLAEGGKGDHGKLLIGERQVINALNMAQSCRPHLVIAMGHHPFQLLQEFDRRVVQKRIEDICHFYHCGHLHEPESRNVGEGATGCLTLAAGASFETRHSRNAYSLVTVDLLHARRSVKIVQYNPGDASFSFMSPRDYSIEVTPSGECSLAELAQSMKDYHPALSPYAHFLAALLLEQKTEIPISTQNGHTFGSMAVLQLQTDTGLMRKTVEFMTFKNVLRVLYGRVTLSDIFTNHGERIVRYGTLLAELCQADPRLKARVMERERDSQTLSGIKPGPFSYTTTLLADLAASQEWSLLREHADRHLESSDPAVAIQAKRMLALSLAHSEEAGDKSTAIELYRELIQLPSAEATDFGNLATLLADVERFDEAKDSVLQGIQMCAPTATGYFFETGQKIIEATGDRAFRKQLEEAIQARDKRG